MLEQGRIDDVDLAHLRAMRVAVAKDVLVQLRRQKYVATAGQYVDLQGLELYQGLAARAQAGERNPTVELQQELPKLLKLEACEVCAIGASLLSYAKLFDDTPIGVEYSRDTLRISSYGDTLLGVPETLITKLGDEFSRTIELVFEGWSEPCELDTEVRSDCSYPSSAGESGSKERMRWIMHNVIKNGGVFLHKAVTGQEEY